MSEEPLYNFGVLSTEPGRYLTFLPRIFCSRLGASTAISWSLCRCRTGCAGVSCVHRVRLCTSIPCIAYHFSFDYLLSGIRLFIFCITVVIDFTLGRLTVYVRICQVGGGQGLRMLIL